MRQHPDREAVLSVIETFLSERVFRGWAVSGLHYDFLTGAYQLICTCGDLTVKVKLLTEWIDEALDSQDSFKRRRVKRALKEAFKIDIDLDDNGAD